MPNASMLRLIAATVLCAVIAPVALRAASDSGPPKPPKLGTVYRFHLTSVLPDAAKMMAYLSKPEPRGPAPTTVLEVENLITVTAVDNEGHTVNIETSSQNHLVAKAVQIIPNNPLLQPTKSENAAVEGQPFHSRRSIWTEKLNIDSAQLFPLSAGKVWSSDRTESTVTDNPDKPTNNTISSICSVVDEPTIVIAAGTFRTFEIVCFGRGNVPGTNLIRYYAPDIGIVVRTETIQPLNPVPFVSTNELVSIGH